jgi:predicted deacylase
MKRKDRLGGWVVGVWGLNVACILISGIALVYFWELTPFASAGAIMPTEAIFFEPPTFTPSATLILSSRTSTPNPTRKPTITPYIFVTDTPTPPPWMQGPITIGYSVAGRPLELYRFGDGPIKRMIVAGIHGGNEWNTISLADELIAHLRDHPETIPDSITLYILRNLNPDGEARGRDSTGRTNDHGVDLNRNFPSNWKSTWDEDGCWTILPVTAGAFAGSEPETVVLMIFIQQHKLDALISYHSAALGIFPGGSPPDKYSVKLAEALADISNYPYPPVDTGCEYTGNLADWASSRNIAAVDLELTNHSSSDFTQNLIVLKTFLNWKR